MACHVRTAAGRPRGGSSLCACPAGSSRQLPHQRRDIWQHPEGSGQQEEAGASLGGCHQAADLYIQLMGRAQVDCRQWAGSGKHICTVMAWHTGMAREAPGHGLCTRSGSAGTPTIDTPPTQHSTPARQAAGWAGSPVSPISREGRPSGSPGTSSTASTCKGPAGAVGGRGRLEAGGGCQQGAAGEQGPVGSKAAQRMLPPSADTHSTASTETRVDTNNTAGTSNCRTLCSTRRQCLPPLPSKAPPGCSSSRAGPR